MLERIYSSGYPLPVVSQLSLRSSNRKNTEPDCLPVRTRHELMERNTKRKELVLLDLFKFGVGAIGPLIEVLKALI